MNAVLEACVRCGDLDSAMKVFDEMSKREGCGVDRRCIHKNVPEAFERGFLCYLFKDPVTSPKVHNPGALQIFGEMIKQAGKKRNLRPKPHLYVAMMRAFAIRGDFDMVKRLHARVWSDSVGSISPSVKREAYELLMEAAVNCDQVDVARQILFNIISEEKEFTWTSRGGMVAVRIEAVYGCSSSLFGPYMLPQISLDDPVEKYMTAFEEAYPLPANLSMKKVAMRFLKDSVVPIIDDWGSCVGIVHSDDCNELDVPLSSLMRGPPPCVTTSTSIGQVLDLILEKKYKMVVVVRNSDVYDTSYSSSSRPVGVFTREKFFEHATATSEVKEPSAL